VGFKIRAYVWKFLGSPWNVSRMGIDLGFVWVLFVALEAYYWSFWYGFAILGLLSIGCYSTMGVDGMKVLCLN